MAVRYSNAMLSIKRTPPISARLLGGGGGNFGADGVQDDLFVCGGAVAVQAAGYVDRLRLRRGMGREQGRGVLCNQRYSNAMLSIKRTPPTSARLLGAAAAILARALRRMICSQAAARPPCKRLDTLTDCD